jgi:drug/metabolite transporter (DMT)-like permease
MSGVAFLALGVVFASAMAMIMKVADSLGLDLGQFLAFNYLVCSLGLLFWGAWQSFSLNSPFIWSIGVFIGFMYVLSLWLFDKAIANGGLALSTTLMRLSAAIPTLGSLLFFAENANQYQVLGLILAFLSLPLANKEPLRVGQAGKEAWKGMLWGVLLFAVFGLTDFTFKIQAEIEPLADPKPLMAIIFGTALLLTFPQLFKGNRPSKSCFFWGVALGIMNVLGTYFWIRTLFHLPGAIAYPTLGLGVILVTTLASLFIWREKLRPANYAFLALASLAVVLINLG